MPEKYIPNNNEIHGEGKGGMEKYKLKYSNIIFDFDSTVADVESLDFLYKSVIQGHPDHEALLADFEAITNQGMSYKDKIPFDESLSMRIQLLIKAGATKEHVDQVAKVIMGKLSQSFESNKDFFKGNSDHIYVVSGGFEEVIIPATNKLGIKPDHVYANRFVYDDTGRIVGIDDTRLTSKQYGKANTIKSLGLAGSSIIVGDGSTDMEIRDMGVADKFIAYTQYAKRDEVVTRADGQANSFEELKSFIIE
jgi:D-3-phosphoglycerate dehydrogenase